MRNGKHRTRRQPNGRLGQCVYCGKMRPLTRDHIPPACLFASPRPSDLISVPSCRCCNEGASQDDEYFRLVYSIRYETYTHQDARGTWPAVLRSLKNPKKSGFKKSFYDRLQEVSLYSDGGIYLGQTGAYSADLTRIRRTVTRIMKGLFYHMKHKRFPDNCEIISYVLEEWQQADPRAQAALQVMIDMALGGKRRSIGKGVFTYWFRQGEDDDNFTIALFRFFGADSTAMLAATVPPEEAGTDASFKASHSC